MVLFFKMGFKEFLKGIRINCFIECKFMYFYIFFLYIYIKLYGMKMKINNSVIF